MRPGAAAARHAPPGDRAEPGGIRDGHDHHGPRERPRRAREAGGPRSGRRAGGTRAATTCASSARPAPTAWSWRFGGHHVSVHHTVIGGRAARLHAMLPRRRSRLVAPPRAASAPAAGGLRRPRVRASAVPRVTTSGRWRGAVAGAAHRPGRGEPHRPAATGDGPLRLARVWRDEWTGRAPGQSRAVPGRRGGEGRADERARRRGCASRRRRRASPASAMTPAQHEILKALLGTYLGRLPDEIAEPEMAKVTGPSFPALHLAWAGSLEPARPHYYRIQGHRLLVEYDNTTRDANHAHTRVARSGRRLRHGPPGRPPAARPLATREGRPCSAKGDRR